MPLNNFNASLFEGLSDEHLQDWLDLKVEVEEVRVDIVDLDLLISALLVGNVDCGRRSIDVIVWLNHVFIDHVVTIVEFLPVMSWLHLDVLLLVHILNLLLLRHLLIVDVLAAVHLVLHLHLLLMLLLLLKATNVSVTNHAQLTFIFWSLFLRAAAAFFCFSTLIGSGCMSDQTAIVKERIDLLTDWDDECGESVTSDDTSVVHNVLRSNLPTDTDANRLETVPLDETALTIPSCENSRSLLT